MTEFHLVPDEVDSPGSFALHRDPAGVPTGGLCHSTRLSSGTPCPTAFAKTPGGFYRLFRVFFT